MSPMSNVRKIRVTPQNGGGDGCYVVSGNVIGQEEHEKLAGQAKTDNNQRLSDAAAAADAVLKQSEIKCGDMVAGARAEAKAMLDSAKKQGFAKGYDDGFRKGYREGTQAAMDERQPLNDALLEFSKRLSEYYGRPVDKYAYLGDAFELAQRVISMELAKNDEAFFGLYKKAALHISNVDKALLKVGPRGYAVVQAEKDKFENAIEGLAELKTVLAGDDDGLCLLETSLGNIDASVAKQLSRAKNIILPQNNTKPDL
jgi:flagellar assembly protein FliH